MDTDSRRAILAALAANAGLAVAKLGGYLVTGATSLLAESVHSIADSTNQALLLFGGAAAERPPTAKHPFGFGRERYFWAFVVSLVIFSLGGLFAIYQGVDKIFHPHPLESPGVAVVILLIGIALEGYSFRTAVRAARPLLEGRSWWRFIRDTRNPELPVVLLEDLGALLGLVIALVGVGLAVSTGDARFDSLGSVAIGLLLCAIAGVLAIEMKSLLIGESAPPRIAQAIRSAMLDTPRVRRVIHMRTQHMGPDQLLVGAKLEFDDELSFRELADAIDAVEQAVRSVSPAQMVVYIEPDVFDPAEAAPSTDSA